MLAGEAANSNSRASTASSRAGSNASASAARGDPVLGFAGFDHRPVERCQRFGEQRVIGGAALDPPRRLAEQRQRALRPAEQLVEPGQRFARLEPGLHRRALFGEAGFLALLGRQRFDLAAGMFEIVTVAFGRGRFGAGLGPARPRSG